MSTQERQTHAVTSAVHALREARPDPAFETEMAAHLREAYTLSALVDLYGRFAAGTGEFDALMRRIIWRAGCRAFGDAVRIEPGVGFKHIETFQIGSGVFIGSGAFVQGRVGGTCRIGERTWIGPQSYFDARDLIL
jgi:hypothetical protein